MTQIAFVYLKLPLKPAIFWCDFVISKDLDQILPWTWRRYFQWSFRLKTFVFNERRTLTFQKTFFFICSIKSPLKIIILKALFVLKILKFLVMWKKRINYKDKVNFKIFDLTTWLTHNYNTHIAQYFTK